MKGTLLFMTNEKMGSLNEDKTLSFFNSQYLEQYNKNKHAIKVRHHWKTQGTGAKFMGMDRDLSHLDASKTFQRPTGICLADDLEHFIYTIQVDEFFGVFSKSLGNKDEAEGHIMHTNNIQMYDLDYNSANQKVALSLGKDEISKHLALLDPKTAQYKVLTEGECVDANPSWSKAEANTIIYDSCGIGVDGNGIPVALGECNICRLNLDTCEIDEVIGFEGLDCIKPKEDASGNIYFIRRPKAHKSGQANPVDMLINFLLIPVKIARALFMWLNFFTIRYTGDSLSTNNKNGTKAKKKSEEELFIEGNLIKADQNQKANERKGEKYAGILPRDWELMKYTLGGELTSIKKGVLAFDLHSDGSITYSNGKHLIRLLESGEEEKLVDLPLVNYIKIIDTNGK